MKKSGNAPLRDQTQKIQKIAAKPNTKQRKHQSESLTPISETLDSR